MECMHERKERNVMKEKQSMKKVEGHKIMAYKKDKRCMKEKIIK